MHHDQPAASHPGWRALLAAGLLGYIIAAITIGRRYRRQLAVARAQALHDPLTGLPNRRAAVAEVHTRLAGGPFLLALLDLDDFKAVNDSHGHLVGDDLLRVVAVRLYLAIPPDGYAARLAGDEFLLLLPNHSGEDPAGTVSAVLALLAEPVTIGAATLRPHASAGVATSTGGPASWRQLLAAADRALYRAKTAGGHTVAVHDPNLDPPAIPDGPRPRTRRRDHRHNSTADPGTPTAT